MSGPHPAVAAVRTAVRRHLESRTVGSGAADVLVAVSGGADSLALAAATAFVAARKGLRAGAVVVDHALQPGSRAVAEQAGETCSGLGLEPVEVVTVQVQAGGKGPEAAARDARYAALDRAADALGVEAVLLGHTRDDQAETVLLALARGSGTRSLSGMPAVRGRWRRPLLDVPRATTRAACAALGLTPWDDPHNEDPRYARVRARALLPLLERELGPGAIAGLARSAVLARDDADALDAVAREAFDRLREEPGTASRGGANGSRGSGPSALHGPPAPPGCALAVADLAALAPAVRRRVLRLAVTAAGASGERLTSTHLASLDALVTDWHGQEAVALPGGGKVARRLDRLTVRPM